MPSETTRPVFDAVRICNIALTRLGASRITSIDDPQSEEEGFCQDLYEGAVVELLGAGGFPWSFATKCSPQLSPVAKPGSDIGDWSYAFLLPNDCLAVQTTDQAGDSWEILGERLVSDRSSLRIWYTCRAPERSWSTGFARAATWKMSSELAVAIQNDDAKQTRHLEICELLIARARAADAGQSPSRRIVSDAGIRDTRFGNARGFAGGRLRW